MQSSVQLLVMLATLLIRKPNDVNESGDVKNTSGVRNTSGIKIQVMQATAVMLLKGV
jgi:hypothetical protein